MAGTPRRLAAWAYVLAVPDIARSAAYYRDVLGFMTKWDEAPDWRLVQRGDVRIMLGQCPDDIPASQIGSHNWFGYVDVDDVDALHAEIAAKGAVIKQAPIDRNYGMREMVVETPDGHRLMFGQELKRGG